MAERREAQSPQEKAGATFAEGTDGVRRLTSAPDDPNPEKDAARVGPVVPTQAPQHWNDVSATFSEGAYDPHEGSAEALNAAQSRATVAHAVEKAGQGIGPASGDAAGSAPEGR
jgi:hypothetical protein